ncbi:MAG: Signal recognition particle [Phylliscum demangeonii]|nr:MAG: Signal recognition particle [Phylliscum demangeonii]
MVLQDLGRRINAAVSDLTRASTVFEAMIKEICGALLEADVNVKLVGRVRAAIKARIKLSAIPSGANQKRLIQKAVFEELVALVDPQAEAFAPRRNKANVIMFVGLQGAGKTTSCTKLARWYQTRGFRACLVCADTFRAGAFDQLKQNATRAKIPYYGSLTATDPVAVARDGVEQFRREKFEVIIVDTSGRHRQERDLFAEMVQIQAAVRPQQTIMVLDASIGQQAEAQSVAFKAAADFGAIIITKTDGNASGGGAISAVAATHTPIVFIGTGEHMQDLERFAPRAFVSKLLGMGDMQGLVEHVASLKLDPKDTIKHLAAGRFTVRDLRDQLSNMMKMGPLSKMATMIPGLGAMMSSAGLGADDDADADAGSSAKLKRMIYICDSMTAAELDSDGALLVQQPARMTRLARGSGTSVREVEDLLSQHRVMAAMAKKMKGGMAQLQRAQTAGGGGGALPPGAAAAPATSLAAMQKRAQSVRRAGAAAGGLGGAGGLAGLGGLGGGMPGMPAGMDLAAMMKALGGGGGGGGAGGAGGAGAGAGAPGMDMASLMQQMGGLMGGLGGGGAGGAGGAGAGRGGGGGRARRS